MVVKDHNYDSCGQRPRLDMHIICIFDIFCTMISNMTFESKAKVKYMHISLVLTQAINKI